MSTENTWKTRKRLENKLAYNEGRSDSMGAVSRVAGILEWEQRKQQLLLLLLLFYQPGFPLLLIIAYGGLTSNLHEALVSISI